MASPGAIKIAEAIVRASEDMLGDTITDEGKGIMKESVLFYANLIDMGTHCKELRATCAAVDYFLSQCEAATAHDNSDPSLLDRLREVLALTKGA